MAVIDLTLHEEKEERWLMKGRLKKRTVMMKESMDSSRIFEFVLPKERPLNQFRKPAS
jgi:hypothetical protein